MILSDGTHRLDDTVKITPADSGLAIVADGGAYPIISGTSVISTTWRKVKDLSIKGSQNLTLWSAKLVDAPSSVDTMLVNGKRAILARYPNANPEIDKFPIGYIRHKTTWTPPANMGKSTYIQYNDSKYHRPSYVSLFTDYRGGVGGQCGHYVSGLKCE